MMNVLIAIVIALFIWHKSSQEVKNKIRNANGYKVIIFAIISFVLLVFYWKTYQVATISNSVNIEAWQYGENEDGTNCDTINELTFLNRFNSSALLPPLFSRRTDRTKLQVDSFLEKRGGLFIEMRHNNHPFAIKRRKDIPENLYNKKGIEAPNNGQLTSVVFISTEVPLLFPIKSYHHHDSITINYSEHGFELSDKGSTRNHNVISFGNQYLKINNGYYDQSLYGTYNINEIKKKYFIRSYAVTDRHANNLDIFTAADVSQITYQILLKSDYYIGELNVDCNIPIQIIGTDSSIVTNTYGFKILDANNHMGSQKLYTYHILLPTFNNLQLIRSLVLTTLITTFLSLFIANVYYWIRKKIGKGYLNHKLNFRQWRSLLKVLNHLRTILFVLFIVFSVILSLLVLMDYPILVPEHQIPKLGIILVFSVVIFVFGLFLYIGFVVNKDLYKSKIIKYNNWIITNSSKKLVIFLLIIMLPSLSFIIWNQIKPLKAEDYYNKATEYKTINTCRISGKEVLNLYKKAANMGSIEAQFDLGCFYLNGSGITPVDYKKSHEYFLKAAEQGHAESQFRVAMNYYYGKGADIDVGEAFRWWEKAAELGHSESLCEVGICLLNGEAGFIDNQKAFNFFMRAALKNFARGQRLVGECYIDGVGVGKNVDEGKRWLQRAANNNDEEAQKELEQIENYHIFERRN